MSYGRVNSIDFFYTFRSGRKRIKRRFYVHLETHTHTKCKAKTMAMQLLLLRKCAVIALLA